MRITRERWDEAQRFEADYWARERLDEIKLMADLAEGWHLTAGLLDIRQETCEWADVLDIAGGDYPLGEALNWHLGPYTVVDPATPKRAPHGIRVEQLAEEYSGPGVDEVWGYNVLQHVIDPSRVLATARYHATKRIRWFDVIDTPLYPVHPHSINADWLRGELSADGFCIVRDIDGSRLVEGLRQKFLAIVAERVA